MKITILQGAFLPVPPLRGGAVEKVWQALGEEFVRAGHEVTHISRHCDQLAPSEHINGVLHKRAKGYDTPKSLIKLKICDLLFTLRARRLIPKSDFVVTNTFWAPIILNPVRHGKLWVHVQRYPKGQMRFYRKAFTLQTVSKVIADAIIEQAPQFKDKVCIIPNPLPPFRIPEMPVTRNHKKVLFVGRIHPEKGIGLLIEAAKLAIIQDGSLEFVFVGPHQEKFGGGGDAYLQTLLGNIKGYEKHMRFLGPIFDQSILHQHYLESGLFVYPSLAAKGEASPVAPLEAMAAGCPILTSRLDCFNDLLGDGIFAHSFEHEGQDAARNCCRQILSCTSSTQAWPEESAAAVRRSEAFLPKEIAARYLAIMARGVPQ